MEEEMDRKLTVTMEDGRVVDIWVLDIFKANEFNKEFIIYTVGDDEENLFASILNESEDSFSLDTITDENELAYVNNMIEKIANDIDGE